MSEEAATVDDSGWEWAFVEIMGHRQHAGRTREEERFGAKMIRIDVPIIVLFENDPKAPGHVERWETRWYSGPSIFSFTLATEEAVMKHNRPYAPPYRLPAPRDDYEADAQETEYADDP